MRTSLAKKILTDAQDPIARGWTKGLMAETVDGQMHYCALGALRESVRKIREDSFFLKLSNTRFVRKVYPSLHTKLHNAVIDADNQSWTALTAQMPKCRFTPGGPEYPMTIVGFNDDPKTQVTDVLLAFQNAINSL